ncbi:hypothetical protein ASF72_19170 [Arthrobacter sp. Leaf141]|uniref:hypothetical protein n=1 Tax=Micrococcaceae TaxID=1268 RepID=UPI0006F5CEC1|nr:hypothetical protein [Arthrobacter sp. Leaf141]KQQ96057.1 hypothetical protein ASF72_19170 [Arthrobacter sp. Leaf141]
MSQVQKPQTLRGKAAWWAAIAVVFIVAVLAFLILTKPAPQNVPQTGDTTTKPTDGCNVPAGDTSSKPAMPSDLRWEADKGWTWPVSDTYGPTRTKDGYGVCFARSPLGAALTAVSMNSSANVKDARGAGENYLVDSKGKDVLLGKTPQGPAATTPVPFAGFIVDSFNPDEASITLVVATAASTSGYAGLPLTLQWVDGDWKVKVLDDGSTFVGQAPVPVKGGFVEWVGSDG